MRVIRRRNRTESRSGSRTGALLIGALAGVVAGILLADRGTFSGLLASAKRAVDDDDDDDVDEDPVDAVAPAATRAARPFRTGAPSPAPLDEQAELEARVLETFKNDPILMDRPIDIGAIGTGIIELTGWVDAPTEVRHATTLTRGTIGVNTVVNRLLVRGDAVV